MPALVGYENPANTVTSTLGIVQLLAQVPGCMMPTASLTKSYLWSMSCPPQVSCEAQVQGAWIHIKPIQQVFQAVSLPSTG